MIHHLGRLFRYRELLVNLTAKELRTRYKGSVLGFFWSLLNPLALTAVYTFIFSTLLKVQVEHFSLFLLTGLFPWLYFSGTLLNSLTCIVSNGSLIKKVAFPTEMLPISVTAANLYNFLLTLVVLFVFLIGSGVGITWNAVLLPVVVLDQTLFALGLGFLVAAVFVYVRDVEHILALLLTIWMYMTPIVYPVSTIPPEWQGYFRMNPMTDKINFYRMILLDHSWPNAGQLLSSLAISLAVAVVGYWSYTSMKGKFPEEI